MLAIKSHGRWQKVRFFSKSIKAKKSNLTVPLKLIWVHILSLNHSSNSVKKAAKDLLGT